MDNSMHRRQWLRRLGWTGAAAGLSGLGLGNARGQDPGESSGFQSSVIARGKVEPNRYHATLVNGQVVQPQRPIPILHETDVLVIGGGSAGVTAAIAAQRAGARVALVERYGHFGGLWTGGLVLLVIGHIVQGGRQVCQGIGEEMMRRLDQMEGAIINRRPGVAPTVDAEALKYLMVEMVDEAGIQAFLHCWGVDVIMEGAAVRGAIFESKSGRQAILAKVVVDATGDGDVFAAAGAEFEHRSHNVGLVSRLGNLDRVNAPPGAKPPRNLGLPTPVPGVHWVNMHGPEVDGLDVEVLTRMEMNHRKFIWRHVQQMRQTPGYEQVYVMETAPQLGVRITRVLAGEKTVTLADLKAGTVYSDVVAVGGASDGGHVEWQIPFGALVPQRVEQLLVGGRCISAEIRMADLVRLIPNCFVTGQAAGVAAAVAVRDGCPPRAVDVPAVQRILRAQEAYLG